MQPICLCCGEPYIRLHPADHDCGCVDELVTGWPEKWPAACFTGASLPVPERSLPESSGN